MNQSVVDLVETHLMDPQDSTGLPQNMRGFLVLALLTFSEL